MSLSLDSAQLDRYSRHIIMDDVGPEGQKRLLNSRALVVGAGGLGSPVIQYLAAAGVGHLTIVDDDVVERSNLQRQIVHGDADIGRPKVDSAAAFVADLNPDITVDTHRTRVTKGNVADIVPGHDVVVDTSDNFPTRYLLNDFCRLEGIPIAHGAIYKFEGQVTTLVPDGPCYRCLFPEAPEPGTVPDCAATAVFGVLPATVGRLQAPEPVKLPLDVGGPPLALLLFSDAPDLSFPNASSLRTPDCPLCGDHPVDSLEGI